MRPPTGKVARLPVEIRNLINHSLRAGLRYAEILADLETRGHSGLTRWNLARWRRSGYREWLGAQETFERLHALTPETQALLGQLQPLGASPSADLAEALLAAQLSHLLQSFDTAARQDRPDDYFRLGRLITAFMHARAQRQRAELARLKYEAKHHRPKPASQSQGLTPDQLAQAKDQLNRM